MNRDPLRLAHGLALAVAVLALGLPAVALLREVPGLPTGDVFGPAMNTAWLALGTVAVAGLVGVPLGLLLGRTDVPAAGALRTASSLPMAIPPFVLAMGWLALVDPRQGWFPGLFDATTLLGMAIVLGIEAVPLVLGATADAVVDLDPAEEEAARLAGAGPLRTLVSVAWPRARASVFEALALAGAGAVAAFGVPYLLASSNPEPSWVLTTAIARALDLDPAGGRGQATALALVLLAGSAAPYAWVRWRRSTAPATHGRRARMPLGAWRTPVGALIGVWATVSVGLPMAALAALVLRTDGASRAVAAKGPLLHSVGLATCTAVATVILGLVVAWAAERTLWPGRGALAELLTWPAAVPGTVLALGALLAGSQPVSLVVAERVTFTFAIAGSSGLLLVAYVVRTLPFAIGRLRAALRAAGLAADEAARLAGATSLQRLTGVALPLLVPDVVSIARVAFLLALSEVTLSVLLVGPDTRVIGTALFDAMTYGDPGAAAAIGLGLACLAVLGEVPWRGGEWRA